MQNFVLCTDLDRTLIPNGHQTESIKAKTLFKQLAQHKEMTLVYVTGRDRVLVQQAIADYDLPTPQYVIADVGSSIYQIVETKWQAWWHWQEHIANDWANFTPDEIYRFLSVFSPLRLQEKNKQASYKLSFYVSTQTDVYSLLNEISQHLQKVGIKANLIWSTDPNTRANLLDILPAKASKLHAIQYLIAQKTPHFDRVIFAGDSGNDLGVLLSEIPAILVANADQETRQHIVNAPNVYHAQGGYLGMNGNYCAGILEGLAHYYPEIDGWLRKTEEHHV